MALIEFDNVSFNYPSNGFLAVDGVSFKIERGENIAIVGQNGAGKTTAVKMINGLLKPTSGNVIVDGNNTKKFTTAQLSKKTGYVFQNPDDQIFHNKVIEEIEFGPKVLGFDGEKSKKIIDFAVGIVKLGDDLEEHPYNLSQSIRKFVTIASIIAMDTDIIILDEPTAGQDLYGLKILEDMLKILEKEGKTVITITHDMEFVVNNFEKAIVMANKKILKVASPKEIFKDDELLANSMLKRPYISSLAHKLSFDENITSQEELVNCIKERIL